MIQAHRKIIHIDMDAFYASVEQRDRPELKGKPVIVGGDPDKRGVVAACSYEARKFGIHSAMASKRAYKLCPEAVFLRPRMETYRSVSLEIRKIFRNYTDLIEPLSLDEAYLDVTDNKKRTNPATIIAQYIKGDILEKTALTSSAGVSYNKFLAKIASDYKKPNGLMVVPPDDALKFIDNLPIRKFFGIGKATERKMMEIGVKTGADLKKMGKETLINLFGKSGYYFYDIAHGIDNRPVKTDRVRKSIGKETTLHKDTTDKKEIIDVLDNIAVKIENLLTKYNITGKTVTLKLKYHDFQSITRSVTARDFVDKSTTIMDYIKGLLRETEAGRKEVRLLGIAISNLINREEIKYSQPMLPF